MTVKYLKLFWYQIFVHYNLKLLDFLSDFVSNPLLKLSSHCRRRGGLPKLVNELFTDGHGLEIRSHLLNSWENLKSGKYRIIRNL